ncbi:MAG: type III pantothenate kinase [Steroidobacteraceae bacterium]
MTAWLLIDAGNSRLKCASWRAGRISRQRYREVAGDSARASAKWLRAQFATRFDRILISSVASAERNRALARAIYSAFGQRAEFARVRASAAGVRCGYAQPWRLGVDRWLAVLAAAHVESRRTGCLVVDAGTALTIDLIDQYRKHRGGLIVPGAAMMRSSLHGRTAGIAKRARGTGLSNGDAWGRDTATAIDRGAHLALVALIERCHQNALRDLGQRPRVVLTGGDSGELQVLLSLDTQRVEDLVLRGLLVLATRANASHFE